MMAIRKARGCYNKDDSKLFEAIKAMHQKNPRDLSVKTIVTALKIDKQKAGRIYMQILRHPAEVADGR